MSGLRAGSLPPWEPGGEVVHAGLPAVGVPAVPGGGGGQLSQRPPAGWLVVVHTVPARGGHQVGRLGLAAPAEACRASLVESVDIEPGGTQE